MGQTCKSAKLALRTVHAKPGRWGDYMQHCGLPPKIWDKLWCAVPLRKPLQHQRVDPQDVSRSRPEKLRAVLGEDADNVLGACTNLVDRVRHSFDAECNKRSSRHVSEGQNKGRKQTKAFWTQINQLLSELPEMLAPTLEADEEHYARHASQTCDRCQRIYRDMEGLVRAHR
mgnify:CR=1 FL=1